MDGLELARSVRAEEHGDHAFILMVTGRGREEELLQMMDAGADDCLSKPFGQPLLEARIILAERAIDQRRRRVAAEAAHRTVEANLDAVIENTNDAILSIDTELRLLTANSVALSLASVAFGVRLELGRPLLPMLEPERVEAWSSLLERTLAGEQLVDLWSYVVGGSEFWAETTTYPLRGGSGEIQGASLFIRNVTERRRAEEALRRSQRDFRRVIESAPDGMVVEDEGRLIYANASFVRMMGSSVESLRGRRLEALVHPEDRGLLASRGSTPAGSDGARARHLRLVREDGRIIDGEWLDGDDVELEGEAGRLLAIRDVTERRRAQSQLMMADRLASVGTLAAGVAHEINNPLSYLVANLQFLSEKLRSNPWDGQLEEFSEVATAMAEARQGAERVRQIVGDLHEFSTDGALSGAADLRLVAERALQMTANEVRHRAQIEFDVPELPNVALDRARLGHVLVSLIINAAQAMDGARPEGNLLRLRARQQGSSILLEVQDTGLGIASDALPRVFDPFFSTREVGFGTGLGLSISRTILMSVGGSVEVESELGVGTTVRLSFPVASGKPRPDRVSSSPPRLHRADAVARILVIDDEVLVGRSLRRALLPHQVTLVTDGREAIARMRRARFDLIFCDLMMPDLTGMDVYEEIARTDPAIVPKIVFMTGGAFTRRARDFVQAVQNPILGKPFDLKALRALVLECLEGPGDAPGRPLEAPE